MAVGPNGRGVPRGQKVVIRGQGLGVRQLQAGVAGSAQPHLGAHRSSTAAAARQTEPKKSLLGSELAALHQGALGHALHAVGVGALQPL